MNSIQINSLPIHEVLADIANAFDTSCTRNCEEYTVELPSAIGTGQIKGISFQGGLGIIQYDCTFLNDMEIKFVVNKIHPLKFLYLMEGTVLHNFENEKRFHKIETYQNAVVASQHHHGHVLQFKANEKTVINSQELDREKFQIAKDCELKTLGATLEKLFRDEKAENSFYHKGFYSLQIADLFKEMIDSTRDGLAKNLFLEGISCHMLSQQIIQYQDDIEENGNGSLLRSYEVKQVEEAAALIHTEIAYLGTIALLAKKVGLNVNKLQNGFQNLYDLTVNEYVKQIRLELAKTLLLNTDYNMSEISEKIGLSSKSYFSKIFKEKYEVTPSGFRQKQAEAQKNHAADR